MFIFTLFGEDSHFDEHIFQRGWFNYQPVIICDRRPFHSFLQLWLGACFLFRAHLFLFSLVTLGMAVFREKDCQEDERTVKGKG